MTSLIIITILILISIILQFPLSNNKDRRIGLILPIVTFLIASVFLILNLTKTFPSIEGYGNFLLEYGSMGLLAMILKVGLIYFPVVLQLAIYFICRYRYKKQNEPAKNDKEFKKMIANDLD